MPSNKPTNKESDPERINFINFLIEKSKDVKSPLSVRELAREYIENNGSSQGISGLISRIGRFRSKIHQMDSIDTEMKVTMLFALGAHIDENFLNELQKDADVEVDKENRITKYRAHNGTLELEGDHSKSAKAKEGYNRMMAKLVDRSQNSIPKTPESTKRSAPEVPNSSKRVRTEDPDDSPRRVRGVEAEPPVLQHLKLEEDQIDPMDPMDLLDPDFEFGGVLRAPGPLIDPKSEADHSHTPQIKFLEAIQSLVLFLGIPPSEIHKKIQQKIQNVDGFSTIQNNEVTLSLELLVARIVNHSVPNLNVGSVSLSHFLCYLKAAILNSRLEGLDFLLEKVEAHIREPETKDKSIPVEKVTSALQTTLDVIGF